jgi:hypothetical protein
VSDRIPTPAIIFQFAGTPPFSVLDEQGTDISQQLGGPQQLADGMVYVPTNRIPELRTHLLHCLPRIAGNAAIEPPIRAWLLHRILTFEVAALVNDLQAPGSGRSLLDVTRALGREGASWAATGKAPAYRHRRLVAGDISPVSHAVNSALYATSLAAANGEENHEVIQGVALAAIFADLAIDEPSERARIDRATIFMRRCGIPSVGAIAGVLSRYAHWDGSGSPRTSGMAIPFEARCVAIGCDYDLLTGANGTMTPYDALLSMGRREGVYDTQMLRLFVQLVGKTLVAHDEAPADRGTHAAA